MKSRLCRHLPPAQLLPIEQRQQPQRMESKTSPRNLHNRIVLAKYFCNYVKHWHNAHSAKHKEYPFKQLFIVEIHHVALKKLRRLYNNNHQGHELKLKLLMVPTVGVEPTQLALQPPQGCVSTNSTTSAYLITRYVA